MPVNIHPRCCFASPPASAMRFHNAVRFVRRMTLLVACILAATALTGCRTRSFLSTRQEVDIGKNASRQVEQEYRVETASADAERVRRVGQSLIAHMDKRDVPYSFKVIDARDINAFSLPGGPVYVYRGLLDMVGNDDDALACILGHECGHVNGRHAAKQISSQYATNFLLLIVPNPTAQNLASGVASLVSLKYSRDDEYDADRRGLSYAFHAGYDPNGMLRFFDKLQRLEKREGGHDPEWLQNHPVTKARIAKAETLIEHKDYRFGQ